MAILENKHPKHDTITGAETPICAQMRLDAMYNNQIVNLDDNIK